MDISALIAAGAAMAGIAGGYFGGRSTVSMQSSAIEALKIRLEEQRIALLRVPELQNEVNILQGLVTQRANVELVIEVVNRIEEKVDAMARTADRSCS